MALAPRSTSSAYVNNASSITVALPAGSVAGDLCILFAGHGYNVSGITAGWTTLDNSAGSNFNGATYVKTLVASDITAGNVTVNFGGAYYGWVALASFASPAGLVGVTAFLRDGSGAASRTITTGAAAAIGDYALYFGSDRANAAVTSSNGASLQSNTANEASGILAGLAVAAAGTLSNTFSYAGAPTGDYQAIVDVGPTARNTYRIYDAGVEVMVQPLVKAKVYDVGVEVMVKPLVNAKITNVGVEIMRSVAGATTRRRQTFVTG